MHRPVPSAKTTDRCHRHHRVLLLLVCAISLLCVLPAQATDIERAKRMHDRLVGIPPDAATLAEMVRLMNLPVGPGGGPAAAALYALENPVFYRSTLKNWVTPWTNATDDVYAELNDYSATVIGMIRDEVPFNTVLSADLVYVYVGSDPRVSDGYSQRNNDHYRQIEAARIDLSDESSFVGVAQSSLPGSQITSGDAAGVITTRAAGEAFFSGGTNRRMWLTIARNYLCREMEDLHDTSRPADWIRQDVSRSPGGDSSIFLGSCIGCHNGMDPMAGAFAFFEWQDGDPANPNDDGRVVHTPGQVQPKFLINSSNFPFGYVTVDNRWENRWTQGPNAALGWPAVPAGGYGPQSLGTAVGNSEAFATCQVEKVFEQVCFRPDESDADRAAITAIRDDFIAAGYNLKQVFADVAVYCSEPDAN